MQGEQFAGVKTDNILPIFAHEVIRGRTISQTHLRALKDIIWHKNSTATVTEDGEKIIEVGPRTYVIEDIINDRYVKFLPFSEKFLNEYTRCFLDGYPEGTNFEYDYHSRLYHYNKCDKFCYTWCGDQIAEMTERLVRNYNTRRAVAITWNPMTDNVKKDCPCLQYIQFMIRADALHMNVLFRSNDMLSGYGNNVFALTTLHKNVTDIISRSINKKLNYGYYNHTVVSPHIYYERDAAEYGKVVDYLNCNRFI